MRWAVLRRGRRLRRNRLIVGPVFNREALTGPRQLRFYVTRAGYVAAMLALVMTAWMVLAGTQVVENVGDLARFGATMFQILAPLQLALVMFFSAMWSASSVAIEKDRRTLVLLLLTDLTSSELVVGKLLASLLQVASLLTAVLPLFMFMLLLGGVSVSQVALVFAVTAISALAAGSLGSTVALWREKTFQSLAMTALILVLWLVGWEGIRLAMPDGQLAGIDVQQWAISLSPWQAILAAVRPLDASNYGIEPLLAFLLSATLAAGVLNLIAVWRIRVWNPSREARPREEEAASEVSIFSAEVDTAPVEVLSEVLNEATGTEPSEPREPVQTIAAILERRRASEGVSPSAPHAQRPSRRVWNNPILWREIRTWAYGRRILMIRIAYLLLMAVAFALLQGMEPTKESVSLALVPLFVVSLVLVNMQSVTSLTTERDARALDLLLVTDLTPSEFVFGKLGGVFFNAKEYIVLPLLLCVYLWAVDILSLENLAYVSGGWLVMNIFVAMLGVHAGMNHDKSRIAIGTSIGTVFFLFLGIATCMRLMVAFSGSFQMQLAPFTFFMIGGGVGLYVSLGARNPSAAILLASIICPVATFYAITSFLLNFTLGVFLVVVGTYGFTTAALLIPAVAEFDVATGRTQAGEG